MRWNVFDRGASQAILRLENEHWNNASGAPMSILDAMQQKPLLATGDRAGGSA